MSRAVKKATMSYNNASYDIESIPVGVPSEREKIDISALNEIVKKFAVSDAEEKGEIEVEVLKIGAISTTNTASALSIVITDEDNTSITLSFGNCYLIKVDPGSASTGDRKATQKLTFCPVGGGSDSNGSGTGGGTGGGTQQ